MRKFVLAFAALAAFGFILPLAVPAKSEEAAIVIKSGDRDQDRDQDHDRRWHRDRDDHKVVIIKKHRDHDRDND